MWLLKTHSTCVFEHFSPCKKSQIIQRKLWTENNSTKPVLIRMTNQCTKTATALGLYLFHRMKCIGKKSLVKSDK